MNNVETLVIRVDLENGKTTKARIEIGDTTEKWSNTPEFINRGRRYCYRGVIITKAQVKAQWYANAKQYWDNTRQCYLVNN